MLGLDHPAGGSRASAFSGAAPFALSAVEHARLLHPESRRGVVTLAEGGKGWAERAIRLADLEAAAANQAGQVDQFISQQSFFGWRRIAHLAQLGACYVDLDVHRMPAWASAAPEQVTDAVLRSLQDARLPMPSYVLFTGRGLLAVWLHSLVPRAALPRWTAIQRQLANALGQFGADPRALDAARVFRLAGSRNGRTGAVVRPCFLAGSPQALWRWDFEDLAREVLPLQRDELRTLQAGRTAQRGRGDGTAPRHRLTFATYGEAVLTDLQTLRKLRWAGPLPPGQRDTWLFLACTAMAWMVPAQLLRREFHALAREAGGWSEGEADRRMGTVFRRAEAAAAGQAAGQAVGWAGRTTSPRYRLRAATIVDWLQITPAEMREGGLRVLVDQDIRRERGTARQRARRRRAGVQERAAYEAAAAARRAQAAGLRQQGLPWAEVARRMELPSADAARVLVVRGVRR